MDRQIAKSLSAKVLKAMSIFSGVQVVSILCSIVRTKFIAIWIGEIGVGLFAIFNNVLEMLTTATQLNMRESAVRDISKSSESKLPEIASAVRWWGRRLGLFGAAAMLVLSPVLSIISFGDTSWWWAFALLAIGVFSFGIINSEQAIMQGAGRLKALAKSSVIAAVIATTISVPLYYLLGVASIIPTILLFAIMVAAVSYYSNDVKTAKTTRQFNIAKGKSFLSLGAYLTVSSVFALAASYVFLSYLNQYASTDDVGLYQAGYTLVIRYTGIIFTALSMEYFPRITQIADRKSMASAVVSHEMVLILYVLTPLLVAFVALDQLAVRILYTESFLTMLPFVTIGIGAMIFRSVSYCMAYVIISRGDGRKYIVTEVISALVGLTLNITMYHYWGFTGLGCSYVLWYVIYTIIVGIVYRGYDMRLSYGAITCLAYSTVIVAAAIILKYVCPLCIIIPMALSLHFAYMGYKRLILRHK